MCEETEMEKKKTNRVRMYLMLSGLSILLIGCTQINENEENVSQLETEENISLEQERFFHDEPHSYRYTREGELLYEMQKSFQAEEYLEQEIPELDDYEYYINKKSEGQAFLIVESHPYLMELYGEDKKLLGYYYLIYVGEEWEDHRVNWDWFYVREDLEEILWCEIVDGTLYSMEDWRESLQYKRRCDMIMDLRNQEKELASLSLSEENDLTPERFFFQPDENVICVYEGTIEFDSINDKYALYKETAEKNIIFVNMLFVEKETGMIYTWERENLVSVSIQEAEKLNLPGDSALETEHDWSYENISESDLLSKVMEMLKEAGHSEKNLIYDGTIDFIHRSYYMVSAFENFEDHIVRGQTYYIERKDGYLYRVEEEPDSLRTELYYIGDCKTETIQPFSVEDMRTFKKNHSVILYEELENILTKTPSKSESNNQNDKIYNLLNHDLLGKDFLNKVGKNLIKSEARIGLEEVKGAFAPTIYESDTFPQELVVMLEKALYDSCDEEIIQAEESFFFDQTANAMGAEKFMLDVKSLYFHFPKIEDVRNQLQWKDEVFEVICQHYSIQNKCSECFYIPSMDGKDYYVFVYQSGESNGAVSVCLTERKEDEFVPISKFETQNTGYGKVIQYGEEFYYIFLQYNYNLKVHDGIKIHRLKGNPEEENLLIRYLPKQYIWRESQCASMHLADLEVGELIEDYLEEIKVEITSEPYLDSGTCQYGIEVYYGDEKETTDFTLGAYEEPVYKIDLANCNVPVYIWKTEYIPSNIGTREFLRTKLEDYQKKAEENMVSMIKEREENKKKTIYTTITGIISTVAFITLIIVVGVYMEGKIHRFLLVAEKLS